MLRLLPYIPLGCLQFYKQQQNHHFHKLGFPQYIQMLLITVTKSLQHYSGESKTCFFIKTMSNSNPHEPIDPTFCNGTISMCTSNFLQLCIPICNWNQCNVLQIVTHSYFHFKAIFNLYHLLDHTWWDKLHSHPVFQALSCLSFCWLLFIFHLWTNDGQYSSQRNISIWQATPF